MCEDNRGNNETGWKMATPKQTERIPQSLWLNSNIVKTILKTNTKLK